MTLNITNTCFMLFIRKVANLYVGYRIHIYFFMHQRILEITNPCELHIQNYQLKIIQEDQIFFVPIHELSIIIAQGQNIRLSTNDLSILAENHVLFLTLNQKYLPSTMTLSFINNSR